jgi:hypothetical protein
MSLDGNSILASLLVSGVGFVLFTYGRKQTRYPQVFAGLVLIVFPYFVSEVLPMFAIALVILAGVWGAVRAGF